MNANALIHAAAAIGTMVEAGLMTKRCAAAARKTLQIKLNEAMEYWSDKGQMDIVDGLNNAYRALHA